MKRLLVFFLLLLSSCNIEKKGLTGIWSIDYCEYNGEEIRLGVNIISFDKKESGLPVVFNEDRLAIGITDIRDFNWETYRNKEDRLMLKIISKNDFFSGDYYVTFFKDEEQKLLMMELKNEKVRIICRKGLVNFDKERSFIEKLIESTSNNIPG